MISTLKLENFKSIKSSNTIELKPLTIFAGPNSSGKSNILEGLAFLAQMTRLPPRVSHTFESNLRHGEFLSYPHPAVDFLAHKKNLKAWITFEIGLVTRQATLTGDMLHYGYVYSYRPSSNEVRQQLYFEEKQVVSFSYKKAKDGGYLSRFDDPSHLKDKPVQYADEALNPESFKAIGVLATDRELDTLELAEAVTGTMIQILRKAYFISAERGHVDLRVMVGPPPEQREAPTWVGRYGQHLIEMLASIFGARAYIDKANSIDKWAQKFGIGNIKAGWRGGSFLGSDFNDPILKTPLELAFASYGSRQLLTMITQLFVSEAEATILIEEPEMSLHPESQILLQELFAEIIKQDKQIICTTHSPFFILALSKVIRSKTLSRDDVAIYHVEKRKNGTEIKKLELNEKGFVTKWIPSYVEIENELFREWAKSLDR